MRAVLTDYAIQNKTSDKVQWLLKSDEAKEIIDYYADLGQEHFLIQTIRPNLTFISEYVFDNEAERPVLYFEKNIWDKITGFKKWLVKSEGNDDICFASIRADFECSKRRVKFFMRSGENLEKLLLFIKVAKSLSCLEKVGFVFFNKDFSRDIYYTIEGGLEKKYLFVAIMDKLLFANNKKIFINSCAFLTNDEVDRVLIPAQEIGELDEIFKDK